MKIMREDVKRTKFGDIAIGGVFIDESDTVYMKTSDVYEIDTNHAGQESRYRHNAICLYMGGFNLFSDDEEVRLCPNAYLIVK